MKNSKVRKIVKMATIFIILILLLSACSKAAIIDPVDPVDPNGEDPIDQNPIDEEPDNPIPPEKTRDEIEEERKVSMGDFYVPLPPEGTEPGIAVEARGIFLTGNTVGITSRFNSLLSFIDNTELNAVVIDVKDDNGLMTYRSNIPAVENVQGNRYIRRKRYLSHSKGCSI